MSSTLSYADAVPPCACGVRSVGGTRKMAEDGVMLALACVLGIVETWIPWPLPGVRVGLANAAVLVVLLRGGWIRAARVSLARVAIVGVATGTLLGPVFALSVAGAATSVACMALAARLRGLSATGISVVGAFSHVAAQLTIASVLIASGAAAALATPVLLSSLPLGLVTGSIAGTLISRLEGIGRRIG